MQTRETAIQDAQEGGKLPCATAHRLCRENSWSPSQLGEEANRLTVKITFCQLGLFGYKAFGQKGPVQRFSQVPDDVAAAITAVSADGKVPCDALWKIAEQRGLPRVAIGCAAETLDLKVSPCQLGCF
jgi:hypothetical protein